MTDATGITTWTYDSLGRLSTLTDGSGDVVSYGYDLADNVVSITYPGIASPLTYAYDAAGRMVSAVDWDGRTTTFAYDANADLTGRVLPNGVATDYAFDPSDALVGIEDYLGSTPLAETTYGRSPAGQLASATTTGAGADSATYDYDPLTQLLGDGTASFSYDAADRITALGDATAAYDSADQLVSMDGPRASVAFSYDARGNRLGALATPGVGQELSYDGADRLVAVDVDDHSATLAGGWYHSAAAASDGSAWTWGYGAYGQLGNGTTTDSLLPSVVTGLEEVAAVDAGAYHSLAVDADGQVWAWGWNGVGQLGDGTTTDSAVPVAVAGLGRVTSVAAGASHSLALDEGGQVWAWGYNSNGQLGDGSTTDSAVPVAVSGLDDAVAIAAGYTHSVALRADGSVWTWGYGAFGQLGNGSTTDSAVPVAVAGLSDAGAIAAGYFHTLAIDGQGSARAWGYGGWGQLGDGTTANATTPVAVAGLASVRSITADGYQSFAVDGSGGAWGWGWNDHGQLGDGTTTARSLPIALGAMAQTKGLAAGPNHSLGLGPDGSETRSWGWNGTGTLGDGTTTSRLTPTAMAQQRGSDPVASYAYDGDGLRVARTRAGSGVEMVWDRTGTIPRLLDDGTHRFLYGGSHLPYAQVDRDGQVHYLHGDALGSLHMITDATGSVTATRGYDPWGRLEATTGAATSAFGFAGEYRDAETGLVYLRARYYDPATAQFLTRDPLEAITRQPYAYAGNNPVNNTDPLGLNKCEVGLNPLRWGGNAVDCVSKADATEVVEVVNKASGVVAAGAGICTAAGAASIIGTPVAGVCATVGAGALTVNVGTGFALTATGNKSPGSYAVDLALAGAGGVARSGAQASGRFAQANMRTGGILGFLGVPTGREVLGELGYAFGWTGSFLTDVTSLIRTAADC